MRFFLVDDSITAIALVRQQLLELGHQVETETDSTKALSRIEAARPDVVILDIMMPGVDGLDLCRQVRSSAQLKGVRIIVMSAKPYEHDRNRAMELGANGFINKISDRDHLLERVLDIAESRFTLKFWGVRGTLPVPGPRSLKYGGHTNCVTLELPTKTLFIFDAGSGIKALSDQLLAERRSPVVGRIFISHPHWDHINALPFFVPLYVKGNRFEILGSAHAGISMEQMLSAQMDGVYFPVTAQEFAADVRYRDLSEGSYQIDGVNIDTMLLKHPGHCLGYRVDCNGQRFCYITDNELYPQNSPYFDAPYQEKLTEFVRGAKVLVTDSTYTAAEYANKVHWGHSSVNEVAALAHAAGVETLYLYHHDPDQDDDAIDNKLETAHEVLLSLGSKTRVEAPAEGTTLRL